MTRLRRDIDDLDDNLFDREEAQRLRTERAANKAEWQQRAIEQGKLEAERHAAVEARVRGFRQRNNSRAIERQYEIAGVSPVDRNADGSPACTLALLLTLGWTIQTVEGGDKRLVAPPTPKPWTGHRDRDSLPET